MVSEFWLEALELSYCNFVLFLCKMAKWPRWQVKTTSQGGKWPGIWNFRSKPSRKVGSEKRKISACTLIYILRNLWFYFQASAVFNNEPLAPSPNRTDGVFEVVNAEVWIFKQWLWLIKCHITNRIDTLRFQMKHTTVQKSHTAFKVPLD